MESSPRPPATLAIAIVVTACAASAGAHAALIPTHLQHQQALGVAFALAAAALVVASAALTVRPHSTVAARLAALVLFALIAAYALGATTGLPWLADEAERADAVGVATKAVEAIGLLFALQLKPT